MLKFCKRCNAETARYANGACKPCARAAAQKRHEQNREHERIKALEYARNRRVTDPKYVEAQREYQRQLREADPERDRRRYAANIERERARNHEYRKANPHKVRAKANKRRAMKLHQRCGCCSDSQIEWFYEISGPGFEVDHIVPLRLGGHHCMRNLQTFTVEEHKAKTRNDNARIAFSRRVNRLLQAWKAPIIRV